MQARRFQLLLEKLDGARQGISIRISTVGQVLDRHDHRRQPTTRLYEQPQHIARAQADQHTVQPLQHSFRCFEAEKIEQQAEVFGGREAKTLQTLLELSRYGSFIVIWR